MRVLLVWNEIPESVNFFILTDPTPEEIKVLTTAHGHYINFDNSEVQDAALDKINAAVADPKYSEGFEGQEAWLHRWTPNKVAGKARPMVGPFDIVFNCGFAL